MLKTAAGVLFLGSTCFGYIRLVTNVVGDASPAALFRTDNAGIQFLLNSGVTAGLQSSASGKAVTVISPGSDPVAAVRNALATWNSIATAKIKFLPLKPTSAGIDAGDDAMVIAVAANASEISILGSALAVTATSYAIADGVLNGGSIAKGAIIDSDIIINPAYAFSTDGSTSTDLQAVLTHELGHSLGANHTNILGAVMFQFNSGQRFLTGDDLTFANASYPAPGSPALGAINGTVTLTDGTPVPYALLTAFDVSSGITTGGITSSDGTYSLQAVPGHYQIYAEPLSGAISINVYLSADQASLAKSTKFQTTLFSGSVDVPSGGTVTANIAATPGASTLASPFVAVTEVNAAASGSFVQGGPVRIASGQSADLILAGTGFSTLKDSNFAVYGNGITLHPGSARPDGNSLRVTLDVAARSTPSLASFIVSSPAGTLSFSGALVIVPPTPTFTSKGVVSSASFLGANGDGAVSPGGIYSLFDLPNAPNLGPNPYVLNGPYDAYGNLATSLGNVTVTFGGVPAPMFLSFGGQLNFQVPFEVAGKSSTNVVVNYFGSPSAPITVPVLPVQPALYTSCIDGKTLCAINLKDRTFNSASNPAAKGDYVEVYGTGAGKTAAYTVLTGVGAPAPPGGFTGNYTYTIGGAAPAPAFFGGWTPTAVGLAQWDVLIPDSSATGAVPITVTDASGATSQPGVTIYVK
ncbi:MAG TPA: carboxypeptidase regulatory-like domain-containing protein [Bryobacteraceae bacterium]|nr:carboxypeptidase regulatory-like domain-containing protein [Bryobacteraceae bacterium]